MTEEVLFYIERDTRPCQCMRCLAARRPRTLRGFLGDLGLATAGAVGWLLIAPLRVWRWVKE